jgi:DNA/RNA-binding domain of Phe-tRNA-synthetase-like protein
MQFTIDPNIFDHFPGMRIAVAVARGLDNMQERPEVRAMWEAAWDVAGSEAAAHGNAQSHPRVVPWRESFKAMGISVKEYRSSIEALLRRAAKGGEPFSISPLVDFYNAVSLRHIVCAGGFDLGDLDAPLELRFTREGDAFEALGSGERLLLPPGEVAYASNSTVLTRHFVWRQSQAGSVKPNTRDIFLVSEIPETAGKAVAETVIEEFRDGLERFFGVPSVTFLMDVDQRRACW